MNAETLISNYTEEHIIDRGEMLEILALSDDKLPQLVAAAEKLRRKYKGNKIHIQLLTNARSGNCSQDCAYCAQSCRSTAEIEKYSRVSDERLYGDDEIVRGNGLARHCIGLSGIRFSDEEIADLADRIRVMKKNGTHICCSIGFLTEKQARMLRDAGLDRINHNLNSGREFYPKICSTHTYEQRLENLHMLKEVGFELCCGGIIGMGESDSDIADMLTDVRGISPESVPINFLLPIKGTRLGENTPPRLTAEKCLKVLCLARLMLPRADIRCAAGREVYFKGREDLLFRVVDSIFAEGYLTESGQGIKDTIALIEGLGYDASIDGTEEKN